MTAGSDAVVKIDAELLKNVKTFISKKSNKLKYVNKKQFVSVAVLEKLENEGDSPLSQTPKRRKK